MLEDLRSTLNQTLNEMGLKKGMQNAKVLTCWEEVVGEKIAPHAQAFKVKKDTLFVTTSSPVWAQELSLIQKGLVDKINKHLGQERVHEIRFFPRGVKPINQSDVNKSTEDLHNIQLTKRDIGEIDDIIRELSDGKLKQRLRKILIRDKKLKRGQKKRQ